MDGEFQKLKSEVETNLGRPIDQAEEIELKALYCFGKGVKVKTHLESEPERLGDVCKRVLEDVRQRAERVGKQQRRARVFSAVKGFMDGRSKRGTRRTGQKAQANLWQG